jgi:hypothetical protein
MVIKKTTSPIQKQTQIGILGLKINHLAILVAGRVARWYIFKPQILFWKYYRGPLNGKCSHILWPFGIFDSHLV